MRESADIIIVGGGVIGVSIAYHLAQRKAGRVILLERDSLGNGSTGLSVASVDWLTLHPDAVELITGSAAFFTHCDELLGAPCGYEKTGSITLAGPEQEETLKVAVARLQEASLETFMIDLEQVQALEAGLDIEGLTAASYASGAGYLDPALTTQAFAKAARRLGVDIRQGQMVTGLRVDSERITGVETADGVLQAPVAIIAAGAWSGSLLASVGLELPLQAVQHPVVCVRRPATFSAGLHSLLDLTTGIYARPESGGLTLLGSIDPHVGYDPIDLAAGHGYVHDDYIFWAMERLLQRYPQLETSELRDGWSGIMSITPDWQPIIGPWPDLEGLFMAVGFSGRGIQICPASADLLAGLVVGEDAAALKLSPFSPNRFATETQMQGTQHGLLG